MTVSPKRPQDGTLQRRAGGNGVESDDRSSLNSLPPTLFKLPNLDANARLAAATHAPEAEFPASEFHAGEPELGEKRDHRDSNQQIQSTDRPESLDESEVARDSVFDLGFSLSKHPSKSSSPDVPEQPSIDRGAEAAAKAFEATFTALAQSKVRGAGDDLGSVVPDAEIPRTDVDRRPEVTSDRVSTPFGESGGSRDDDPRIPGPPAVGYSTTTHATSSTRAAGRAEIRGRSKSQLSMKDAPAGRSWMESLGSHGVVIVLLLVVVAAALLTGRGEDDPDSKSLSTQSELLNFDELDVDLPIPTHESATTLADATAAPTTGMAQTQDASSEFSVAPALTDSSDLPISAVADAAAEVAAAPSVSLDLPQPVQTGPSVPSVDSRSGLVANGIQINQFVDPSSGTSARAVSDRTNTSPRDSSLPSLEELAGLAEPVASPTQPTQSSTAPTRIVTETPAGVRDWMKYLPTPPNSAEVPAAGNSSSSN